MRLFGGLWLALFLSFNANAHFEVVGGDILHNEYRLTGIYYDLRKEVVLKQKKEFGGRFRPALRSALDCFLENPDHPESPLAESIRLAFEIMRIPEQEPVPANVLRKAKEILFKHMDLPRTEIRLLFSSEKAENGEKPSENWVFQLKIRTLSDHLQYAIVDRKGRKPTYCYGFN